MGKHTPTGADSERTVATLTADQRAASMSRHPAGRRTMARALVALAAAGLVTAGTGVGIASADTNPASTAAHMCLVHPDTCEDPNPYHPAWADVDPSVLRNGGHFTFWDRVRGLEKELLNLIPG